MLIIAVSLVIIHILNIDIFLNNYLLSFIKYQVLNKYQMVVCYIVYESAKRMSTTL